MKQLEITHPLTEAEIELLHLGFAPVVEISKEDALKRWPQRDSPATPKDT